MHLSRSLCLFVHQARLAQSVERWTLNPTVVGSSPTLGVHFLYNPILKGLGFARCIWDTFEKILHDPQFVSWINTRHPLSRLLSGWNQKFDVNYHSYKAYMHSFKPKTDPFEDGSKDADHVISFRAFIAYLMSKDKIKKHEKFNGHWKSVFSSCLPCSINYQYITRQESSYEDASLVLRLAKIDNVSVCVWCSTILGPGETK